jgi:hypothetical protein
MPHSGSVWSVAFDPRGTWLASGSSDTSIKLWCAQTGRQRHVLTGAHSKFVLSVAFDSAGELLASGGWDKKVLLTLPPPPNPPNASPPLRLDLSVPSPSRPPRLVGPGGFGKLNHVATRCNPCPPKQDVESFEGFPS